VRTAVATLPPDDKRRELLQRIDLLLRLALGFRKT
jgi:hypothetical protein